MPTDNQPLNAMYARVRRVFPETFLDTLATQQENQVNNAIHRVVEKDGPEAVTMARLEGIKELVTQHLWSAGLTAASKNLPTSRRETSETSA